MAKRTIDLEAEAMIPFHLTNSRVAVRRLPWDNLSMTTPGGLFLPSEAVELPNLGQVAFAPGPETRAGRRYGVRAGDWIIFNKWCDRKIWLFGEEFLFLDLEDEVFAIVEGL